MKSLLIEFQRFEDLSTGLLRKGDRYLVTTGAWPVRQVLMPLDHKRFHVMLKALRYQAGAEARGQAVTEIAKVVTGLLDPGPIEAACEAAPELQLDLVLNPIEVAALPFEAITDRDGQPLLLQRNRRIELTRRVRVGFDEVGLDWPASPRILFAWACPPGAGVDVPYQEHAAALLKALEPWIPAGTLAADALEYRPVLTTLSKASLSGLKEVCARGAAEGEPFTHVHLLAHGCPVGFDEDERFGMALHTASGEMDAVLPEALTEALAPLRNQPVIVTLATCSAADDTNTVVPERSIAHELHVSGIPIVVASQLPLTVTGSNLLVATFYAAVLAGRDVRAALHDARLALHENQARTGHDWLSLVGYARLPEGYAQHLLEVRLASVLASLKTTQNWSDGLVQRGGTELSQFEEAARLLQSHLQRLEAFVTESEQAGRPGVLEENLGLLGSAAKRLAEVCFKRASGDDAAAWQTRARAALEQSLQWYRRGNDGNISHHWTGVQSLSLEAVLSGRITEPWRWQAALAAALRSQRNADDVWGAGSLVELYLLAPCAGQTVANEAVVALEDLKQRVASRQPVDLFPLETTRRQLRRYVDWWTNGNGFFPGVSDLAEPAKVLLKAVGP